MSQEGQLHVVLGASGAIGQGVLRELAARDIETRAVSRAGPYKADLLDAEATAKALEGASHAHLCAGLAYDREVWRRDWLRIMDNVIRAAGRHPTKIIFCDNIYMYGPPPLRKPITEEHPQEPSSAKGQVRKEIADSLMRAHREGRVEALIARAPDFYGPGATNSLLYPLVLAKMLKRQRAMWLGDPDRLHSFGHVGDISRSMVVLALDRGSYGQVWHTPTSSAKVTPRQLQRMIAERLGVPAKLTKLGRSSLAVLGMFMPVIREVREMSYQYFDDYVFSSEKFEKRHPGFKVMPYEAGIEQMVDSFRNR